MKRIDVMMAMLIGLLTLYTYVHVGNKAVRLALDSDIRWTVAIS
jgi:hypothetical protein